MKIENIKTWQRRPHTQILAVIVVIVPPYAIAIYLQLIEIRIMLKELFLFPLLIGGGSVALALLVYKYVCGQRISNLNLRQGKWYTDAVTGVLLAAFFLALFALQSFVQSNYLLSTTGPAPQELITLFRGIVNDPLLLALWFGPVVWLGVAAFEELSRVFLLNRLWAVWSQPSIR